MCFAYQALVVWQHDNDLCIMIPNHSPEIFRSMWQRVLGYNKFIAPIIALQLGRWKNQQLETVYSDVVVVKYVHEIRQHCFALT